MEVNLPPFYQKVETLSSHTHADWSVHFDQGLAFTRGTNSVILSSIEFARAAACYPILFAGEGENIFPIALLGLKDKENLFVTPEGDWGQTYVPAYVRRYPFVPAATGEGENYLVCVDSGFSGFNQQDQGHRLFNADGSQSDYTARMVRFMGDFQAENSRTRGLCAALLELDLLEPMQANIELAGGGRHTLQGFMAVSRDRLKALAPEKLSELLKTDKLDAIVFHLSSLGRFEDLVRRAGDNNQDS